MNSEPIAEFRDAKVWYYESNNPEADSTRHEGPVKIFPEWVRLGGGIPTWIPRENIEQIHER